MPIFITCEIFTQHKARANVMRVLGTVTWTVSACVAIAYTLLQVIYPTRYRPLARDGGIVRIVAGEGYNWLLN